MYPFWEQITIIVVFMRVIATNTLKEYWEKYRNASILTNKRVVFNINGNRYRLLVDIEFRLKIVFVIWFGTHSEYDLIDAKTISYAKTDKK